MFQEAYVSSLQERGCAASAPDMEIWVQGSSLGSRAKDLVAEIFVIAEARGLFRKLPAFEPDLSEYPELRLLEENYSVIRAECLKLIESPMRMPRMDELTDYTSGGIHQIQWKSFMFKVGRFHRRELRPRAPDGGVTGADSGIYTAFFSVLEPHQHIKPHWGYWKGFVRYHLGVIVPNDNRDQKCWIRVNPKANDRSGDRGAIEQGARYHWRNGVAVLFDDTFLHDAANESDEVRVVLFLDVARKMPWPLAALNRFLLGMAYRSRGIRQVQENAKIKAA